MLEAFWISELRGLNILGPWKQFQALKGWLIDSRVSPLPSDAQGKMEGRKWVQRDTFLLLNS